MIDNELTPRRRYSRDEAADILNIPKTWLKDWVTDRLIPVQLSGTVRGFWFAYADILKIGDMLPELMSYRQASARVKRGLPAVPAVAAASGDAERASVGGMDGGFGCETSAAEGGQGRDTELAALLAQFGGLRSV